MDLENLDAKRDIQIDPDALDIEWLNQPDLMLDYSLALDEATKIREDAKLQTEKAKDKWTEIKAEVSLEIRKDPENFGLDKVTEASVEATAIKDERVVQAKKEYYTACENFNTAKYNTSKCYSAVRSFEQRKDSLEALVRLLGMQYFASPNVARNLVEEYQKFQHKRTAATKKEVREKIKNRRTR